MMGWRGRIGFLVPPGNPTLEGEVFPLLPKGVTAHFSRLVAHGATGTLSGQEARNRTQIEHIDESAGLLAMVKPSVMVLGHTATSYTLGRAGEAELVSRLEAKFRIPFLTAFGSVIDAMAALGIKRLALGAPYGEETTLKGKAHLEACGLEVVNWGRLEGVTNIYDESEERAYQLARKVDRPEAQAVFLSGVGLPTMAVIEALEKDLAKPVISSVAAMMWRSFKAIGVREPVPGYGRLLRDGGEGKTGG